MVLGSHRPGQGIPSSPRAFSKEAVLSPWKRILFSDLDGTLLDGETYDPAPALEGLARCGREGVPVVFCSSKTMAEMVRHHADLAPHPACPFISENGGGVFFPREHWKRPREAEEKGGLWKVTLGASHEEVMDALDHASGTLGVKVRAFSRVSVEDVARETGLTLGEAERARERDFDEPFWTDETRTDTLQAFRREIERRGMRLTRGGRCFHVHGRSDKGMAARYVRERYEALYGRVRTGAVGDAANDLPLFEAVDVAFLVRRPDGTPAPDIPAGKGIRLMPGAGPRGFTQAVDEFLDDRKP